MEERIAHVSRLGGSSWRFVLTGTPPWKCYIDGRLYRETEDATVIVDGYPTSAPPLEVLDATDAHVPLCVQHPPFIAMQWRGVELAALYVIQEWTGTAWLERARVQETGDGYYRYETPALEDQANALWRVLARDSQGHESVAAEATATVVRHPDPPTAAYDYDETTGALTISI